MKTEKDKVLHKTVLLNEAIEGLGLKEGDTVLDATFGGGGHSMEICRRFGEQVGIIAIDQDKGTWEMAEPEFKNCDIKFFNTNFRDLDIAIKKSGIKFLNAAIFDLGISSDQLESSGRGFSFLKDEPLLMTMKKDPKEEDLTALDIVNGWEEKNIADIIYGYGEEQFSRRIAKKIIEERKEKPIQTTFDLVSIIREAVPNFYRKGKIHFATKTFQALRIAVNDELGALSSAIKKSFDELSVGGRIGVISFHSLEDRIVKRFFVEISKEGRGKILNKKPIVPSKEEVFENKRSRSAKLRFLEKIKA